MTDLEAHDFLREMERALAQGQYLRLPPAHRRRRTGEMRVTMTERRAMQAFHFYEGLSYAALARMFRRTAARIPGWLYEPQYVALREYVASAAQRHGASVQVAAVTRG